MKPAGVLLAAVATLAAALAGAELIDTRRAQHGEDVYQRHCAQCHGARADGQGIHAPRFDPRPSNLAASPRGDDYWLQIITVGGQTMGRSAVMPEWGLELSAQEILAVVHYLRKVNNAAAASAKAKAGTSAVGHPGRAHG